MNELWPQLPYAAWHESCTTLHLWTQVIGKIRLAQAPWLNHSWHVPLYVSARGLTTSVMPCGSRQFEIQFDFTRHVLDIEVSDGSSRQIELCPRSVADFYASVSQALTALGIGVTIHEQPCEIPDAVAFSADHLHAAYDPQYVARFWRVLLQVDRVLKRFRTGFIGKASPVHFFWGSFDLAVTRFSGRAAPTMTRATPGVSNAVIREAYSHELSSAGFWPGGGGVDDAAFYAYAYPAPQGFAERPVMPAAAAFSPALGEYLLPYEAVRSSADPDATLLAFLLSTYEAAADCANWDRTALECELGVAGIARNA